MTRPLTALALFAAVLGTSGCATQQQQLQARQEGAVQSALQRGRFDLNCPAATAIVGPDSSDPCARANCGFVRWNSNTVRV